MKTTAFSMKRALSLLMALLMTLGILASAVACAGPIEDPADTKPGVSGPAETEGETQNAYDSLEREDLGKTFTILTRDDLIDDFYIEKLRNDVLDDSIYERNKRVAEDFGIEFDYVEVDHYTKVNDQLKLQATGGADDYDIFVGHKSSFSACVLGDSCYDYAKLDNLQLDMPWWDQSCIEELTVMDKTFVLNGDINPSSMRISACFVFNKSLMKDLMKSVDDLNAKAANGEWTLDLLYEYTENVTQDLNGDSTMSYMDDRYGLTSWMMDVPYSLFYGAGGKFLSIVDGEPELTATTEDVVNIYEKIFAAIVTAGANYTKDVNIYETTYDVFTEGRALFCDVTLGKINSFIAGMEDEYGILPVPKYDTNQKEYLSFVNGATGLIMTAKSEKNPEFVATVLDAMSAYNYTYVTPNMFEIVTKAQAAQDPQSAAMVDLIIRNRIYDLGYFLDYAITNVVNTSLQSGKQEIASSLESTGKNATQSIRRLLRTYSKFK